MKILRTVLLYIAWKLHQWKKKIWLRKQEKERREKQESQDKVNATQRPYRFGSVFWLDNLTDMSRETEAGLRSLLKEQPQNPPTSHHQEKTQKDCSPQSPHKDDTEELTR